MFCGNSQWVQQLINQKITTKIGLRRIAILEKIAKDNDRNIRNNTPEFTQRADMPTVSLNSAPEGEHRPHFFLMNTLHYGS
jgi:hypothetical protein